MTEAFKETKKGSSTFKMLFTSIVIICVMTGLTIYTTFNLLRILNRKEMLTTYKYGIETSCRSDSFTIEQNGIKKEIVVPNPYQHPRMLTESTGFPQKPDYLNITRMSIVVAAAVFLGIYSFVVLVIWICDKALSRLTAKKSQDIEKRMQDLLKLTIGIVMGVIGTYSFGDDPERARMKIENEAHQKAVINLGRYYITPNESTSEIVQSVVEQLGAKITSDSHDSADDIPVLPADIKPTPAIKPSNDSL